MSEYKQIPVPHGYELLPCPFCGSPAELSEYSDGSGYVSKLVACTNGGDMPDSEDECLMYLPSSVAYKATKREAIEIWNKRADAN